MTLKNKNVLFKAIFIPKTNKSWEIAQKRNIRFIEPKTSCDLAIVEMLKIVKSQNDPIMRCVDNCHIKWQLKTLGIMKATEAVDSSWTVELQWCAFDCPQVGFLLQSIVQIGLPAIL